jgi:hypothetical protein
MDDDGHPTVAAGAGGTSSCRGGRGDTDDDAGRLAAEVARLTREVTQLRLENRNMYWLVDEHKTMRAEIKRLKEGK